MTLKPFVIPSNMALLSYINHLLLNYPEHHREQRSSVSETRKKQVTNSDTNPAGCSTLRMRTAISPWQWQPWTAVSVLVRTHQHGIAPGQVSLTITDPAVYCQGECTSTPLSASSTQHMWQLLARDSTAVLPRHAYGEVDQHFCRSVCQ